MSSHFHQEEAIMVLAEPIARAEGYQIVEVRYHTQSDRPRIRVVLYKSGGITIADCSHFSELLGARLDLEEERLPDGYYLEVSSPGADRTLKTQREFEIFAGREIEVKTYAPVEGQKEFVGQLKERREDAIVIEVNGVSQEIPRQMVARTKLHFQP